MKKLSILVFITILLFSCYSDKIVEKDLATDIYDLVIDVRTDLEFEAGHLRKAINIPYDVITKHIENYAGSKNSKIMLVNGEYFSWYIYQRHYCLVEPQSFSFPASRYPHIPYNVLSGQRRPDQNI